MKNVEIILKIIEWGIENPLNVEFNSMLKKCVDIGYLNKTEYEEYFKQNGASKNHKIDFLNQLFNDIFKDTFNSTKCLSLESYFKYIEHQELEFATKNAKEAKRYSVWAIILSAIGILASVVLGIWQLLIEKCCCP